MAIRATKDIKIFYSYAQKDEALCKQLNAHLSPLRRQGLTSWYDHQILPGTKRTAEIARELQAAHIILLLISADFLASSQCYDVEMQYALQRHEAGEARVIPIILRPVNWQDTPLKDLQALPEKAKPVITWRRKDEAFVDIANGIKRVIDEIVTQGPLAGDNPDKKTISEAFTAQARQRVSLSIDQRSSPAALGTLLRRYDVHASWVVAVAWEPNGTRIASSGGDGTVRIWDAETGESLLTYRGHTRLLNAANVQATVYTVAWAPEGLRIASGYGTNVHVWNPATGQTLTRYQAHTGLLPDIFAIAWSPNGQQIASACSSIGLDKTVHLWDALTGDPLSRYPVRTGLMPNFSVLAVAWSPNGTRLAAACGDKTVRVWNTETRQIVSTYRSEWVSDIAWSPDGRYLALAHSDNKAQIWDTLAERKLMMYHEHTDGVRRIAWSPDGTSIATASNDKTVHIWEPLTGKRIYIYQGHTNWATSIAWSPDGTRMTSASNDKTVHIWQAKMADGAKVSLPE